MNRNLLVSISLLIALAFSSCVEDSKYLNPGNSVENGVVFKTEVKELSGLCYSKDKNSLLAISDNGDILELNLDGTTKRVLPYEGNNDFEGITVNYQTGDIYVVDEELMTAYLLSEDEKTLIPVVTVDNIPNPVYNRGLEGIAYGKDTLYLVNQGEPTRLIKYSLKDKAIVWHRDVTFATFLSDICYDETDDTLWIVDSKQAKVTHCTLNGDVIATQDIKAVPKAEGLFVDRENGFMWVGCDETNNLYKLDLKI